jgi:hypothetical protein
MRSFWLFVSNAAYYYALFFLLVLKGPVISISQLAYSLLLAAVFPLFWTLFFVAVLFAYDKLKAQVPPRLDTYILGSIIMTLDLLYAAGYVQRYFSGLLVCVTLVKTVADTFLILQHRKRSLYPQ